MLNQEDTMGSSNKGEGKQESSNEEERGGFRKWGTHVMGQPAAPTSHPHNQMAASASASSWRADDEFNHHRHPYLVFSPTDEKPRDPFQSAVHLFNSWSNEAETIARNIWHNLKAGPSVSEAAWGKLNLTMKALREGGFESLYKQIFTADEDEKLKKTYACYLSTATGPVAGTLYLSTHRVAFCSDRPLTFTAPSGQQVWIYYKVMIPFPNIANVYPHHVVSRDNTNIIPPPERYIQIITVDGHEFWFMGFVNFEKATHHLLDSLAAHHTTAQQQQPPASSH